MSNRAHRISIHSLATPMMPEESEDQLRAKLRAQLQSKVAKLKQEYADESVYLEHPSIYSKRLEGEVENDETLTTTDNSFMSSPVISATTVSSDRTVKMSTPEASFHSEDMSRSFTSEAPSVNDLSPQISSLSLRENSMARHPALRPMIKTSHTTSNIISATQSFPPDLPRPSMASRSYQRLEGSSRSTPTSKPSTPSTYEASFIDQSHIHPALRTHTTPSVISAGPALEITRTAYSAEYPPLSIRHTTPASKAAYTAVRAALTDNLQRYHASLIKSATQRSDSKAKGKGAIRFTPLERANQELHVAQTLLGEVNSVYKPAPALQSLEQVEKRMKKRDLLDILREKAAQPGATPGLKASIKKQQEELDRLDDMPEEAYRTAFLVRYVEMAEKKVAAARAEELLARMPSAQATVDKLRVKDEAAVTSKVEEDRLRRKVAEERKMDEMWEKEDDAAYGIADRAYGSYARKMERDGSRMNVGMTFEEFMMEEKAKLETSGLEEDGDCDAGKEGGAGAITCEKDDAEAEEYPEDMRPFMV